MAKRQRRRRQERRQEHAKRDGWKTRHSMISGAGLAAGATLALASPAVAAPLYLTVNQSGDAGDGTCDATCTLRDAVDDANANANEFDYIYFSGSISGSVLTAGQISVTDGVGFYGNGPGATTISGGNSSRIFYLNPGYDYSVNFNNLTLANGNAGAGKGGAISNIDANLNIFGSALTGNTAADGGAIYDSGQDYSGYNTDIVASTISGNHADDDGGGFYAYDTPGQVFASTFSGNTAADQGGGLYMNFTYDYGGIYDSTLSGNSGNDGGGVYSYSSDAYTFNTILANNSAPTAPDFSGGLTGNFTLLENTSGASLSGAYDITGADPQLGPLQNNGGYTPTLKPAASSPVVDQGYSYAYYDQRGFDRHVDNPNRANAVSGPYAAVDIGSVELTIAEGPQATPPASTPPAPPFVPPKKKKKCKKKKKRSAVVAKKKKCKKKKRRSVASSASNPQQQWRASQAWPDSVDHQAFRLRSRDSRFGHPSGGEPRARHRD
jgi:hypothetical protein